MTVRERYLYRDAGHCIVWRDASVHVVDNRDKRGLDGKPLYDCNGAPLFEGEEPAWKQPGHFLPHHIIEKEPDEIEFDHKLTPEELREAFPNYMVYLEVERARKEAEQKKHEQFDLETRAARDKEVADARARLGLT